MRKLIFLFRSISIRQKAGGEEDHHSDNDNNRNKPPDDMDYFFCAFVEKETHNRAW